jgi:Tfp pilus assembly protein PilF
MKNIRFKMKCNKLKLALFLNFLWIIVFSTSAQIQTKLPQLVKKVDPSVIKIYTINTKNEYESQGSGVIITNNGVCISNYHVLIGAKKAIAITASGKTFEITRILDYSKQNDLIKFKLEIGSQITTPAILNSLLPQKGAEVFAVGYPNGFNIQGESTLSTGIISGIREENGEKIIQTSTPFTHGSSGGGLFDETGKLLGITSGTFAEDVKDRHANLNKVVPSLLINKLSKNLNLSLYSFFEIIKNEENFIQGMIAYESFDFETAAEYFIAHIDHYPEDATAWFRLGNSFHQIGRGTLNEAVLNSALECFEISISLDTNYYHPWGQAALVFSILREPSLAKSYARQAFRIEPDVSFTNYVIGKVANESGDYKTGVTFLTAAIIMANDYDKEYLTNQWYLERAIANAWLNNDYAAEQDYKSCLSLNSQNLDALFWYGNFLALRNRNNDACIQFRRLKQLSPNYKMADATVDNMLNYLRCY